ncbi:hypothetical protein J4234_03665 [Candidatus Woesearchaeota archaeon]|nr:hypothetical protein [Candidatus Woesearchaeota archaeon]
MLKKNKIDKRLNKYVKEHLSRGYSKHAVKHVLVKHGYDECYVGYLLRRHQQLQYAKVSSILLSLLFIFLMFAFNLIPESQQQATGYAITETSNEGCCTSVCQQTSRDDCYGNFADGQKCNELQACNVGCCIDKEGYCLTNYLYGNCVSNYGINVNKDCSNIVFCRNLTDRSYTARQYNIKNKKGSGVATVKPPADYQKSSFNIKYYLYDKTEVLYVIAELRDGESLVDSVTLYDDGSHNDGTKDDNLYGNNWLSLEIKDFEGFRKLDIDIVVTYKDKTQQSVKKAGSLVVLNNNKCLPIDHEWNEPDKKPSIILAADNYASLKNGYEEFAADSQNFLNLLFNIDKFANIKEEFNFYRKEQPLLYPDIASIKTDVESYCPSYNNVKDLIVILDKNEDYCITESLGVIRTNPQVLFYKNITNTEIITAFGSFCSYILTPKKLADEIVNLATPPKIIVLTLDNITYTTQNVSMNFTVSGMNYPVNYSLSLNNLQLLSSSIDQETNDSFVLNLSNGTNYALIEAKDKNSNLAFVQILLNATIE